MKKRLWNIKDDFSVSWKEGKLLSKLAEKCVGRGAIVEIGSWKGFSTIYLAWGSKSGYATKIYAIDTFAGDINNLVSGEGSTYIEFTANLKNAGVKDIVQPMVMASEQAAREWDSTPIELLWVDGDHDDIEADFERWYPHLIFGGIMAIHDTVYWDNMLPYKVAVRELYKSGKFADVKRVGCITYATKVNSLSAGDKIRNKYALYRRYTYQIFIPYFTKCLVLADKWIKRIKENG